MKQPGSKSLWQRLFPPLPDFLALLRGQLELAVKASEALISWCDDPTEEKVMLVFEIEHEADDLRREIVVSLSGAFDTPLDREDIDDVSRCLDDIVDAMKSSIREFGALKVVPDGRMKDMAGHIREGILNLLRAVHALPRELTRASQFSAKARHSKRYNERIYTQALAKLLEQDDFRTIFRQREAYKQMLHMTDIIEASAEQLEHALNKLS